MREKCLDLKQRMTSAEIEKNKKTKIQATLLSKEEIEKKAMKTKRSRKRKSFAQMWEEKAKEQREKTVKEQPREQR